VGKTTLIQEILKKHSDHSEYLNCDEPDTLPSTQILATGSSSFELSDKIAEPLTGRKRKFPPMLHGGNFCLRLMA
jgi:predicted AAA+ superfamily ATPase